MEINSKQTQFNDHSLDYLLQYTLDTHHTSNSEWCTINNIKPSAYLTGKSPKKIWTRFPYPVHKSDTQTPMTIIIHLPFSQAEHQWESLV